MGKPNPKNDLKAARSAGAKQSAKGSSAGRNKIPCQRYMARGTRTINKAKRILKHIKKVGDNDVMALARLLNMEESVMVFPADIKKKMLVVLKRCEMVK